jgi:hypothetical protein
MHQTEEINNNFHTQHKYTIERLSGFTRIEVFSMAVVDRTTSWCDMCDAEGNCARTASHKHVARYSTTPHMPS